MICTIAARFPRARAQVGHAGGFSVVEMLIVIGLVGLLVAIGIPALDVWLERYRVRTAAQQIGANLQLQRMRAVSRNRQFSIAFDQAGGTYTLFDGRPDTGTPIGVPYELPFGVTFSDAGDPITLSFEGNDDWAVFHPDGSMNDRLAVGDNITLTNSMGERFRASINRVTGRVEITEVSS